MPDNQRTDRPKRIHEFDFGSFTIEIEEDPDMPESFIGYRDGEGKKVYLGAIVDDEESP